MKEIIEYHKPLTGKLQHSCFLVNTTDFEAFQKKYGNPVYILREYRNLQPRPMRISGYGWIDRKSGYSSEVVYFLNSASFVIEYLNHNIRRK